MLLITTRKQKRLFDNLRCKLCDVIQHLINIIGSSLNIGYTLHNLYNMRHDQRRGVRNKVKSGSNGVEGLDKHLQHQQQQQQNDKHTPNHPSAM
ncbi:hypothetical protein RRG08_001627 [Elysia crispata]|uniref:Uncharacterized protein n=1 Tax=Elysia crispata TaxID=231223 RepID=A0AAE1AM40_9GAST|nr:hypothetical protein RRG08_001627 [Elysia crispata]